MPNLINILRDTGNEDLKGLSEVERRKAIEKVLKGEGDNAGKRGMEWGTCIVFSCENDCRLGRNGEEEQDVWREEVVLIQKEV